MNERLMTDKNRWIINKCNKNKQMKIKAVEGIKI